MSTNSRDLKSRKSSNIIILGAQSAKELEAVVDTIPAGMDDPTYEVISISRNKHGSDDDIEQKFKQANAVFLCLDLSKTFLEISQNIDELNLFMLFNANNFDRNNVFLVATNVDDLPYDMVPNDQLIGKTNFLAATACPANHGINKYNETVFIAPKDPSIEAYNAIRITADIFETTAPTHESHFDSDTDSDLSQEDDTIETEISKSGNELHQTEPDTVHESLSKSKDETTHSFPQKVRQFSKKDNSCSKEKTLILDEIWSQIKRLKSTYGILVQHADHKYQALQTLYKNTYNNTNQDQDNTGKKTQTLIKKNKQGERAETLNHINHQIQRLNHTFGILIKRNDHKIAALSELYISIYTTQNDSDIKQIISDWKDKQPIDVLQENVKTSFFSKEINVTKMIHTIGDKAEQLAQNSQKSNLN